MYTLLFKHFKLLITAQKYNSKELVQALLCLCFLASSGPLSAEENNQPEERWFEIEVILYKEITDKGLNNESWDTDTPFSLPEELKDFLNPVGPAELSEDTALEQLQTDSTMGRQANDISPTEPVTELDSSRVATTSELASDATLIPSEDELKEQPFIPLQQSDLQLQKEAKNISVHPSFRMLAHFAWRQPVAGKSTAMPVRFAGGHDYSEEFEFNGSKKLDLESPEYLPEALIDSEKQNEPLHPDDALFHDEWFHFAEEEDIETRLAAESYQGIFCSVDPSMGKQSRRHDPSAIIIGGLLRDGTVDVLEADIVKRHPDKLMLDLFAWHKKYGFRLVGIEEVAFQELFKDHVEKESRKKKLYLPVEGIRPKSDKRLRIARLQPHIKNGVFRFRRSQTLLLDQLRYYPKADHDDGPDALEMLLTLIARSHAGPRIRSI